MLLGGGEGEVTKRRGVPKLGFYFKHRADFYKERYTEQEKHRQLSMYVIT